MGLLDNSLIDKLIDKGADTIGEGNWLDKLGDQGRKKLIPQLDPGLQGAAGQGIDRLVVSKGAIGTMSRTTFLKVTSYLGMGMEDEARLTYLRERATFDERQAALKKASGVAYDANLASEQAWKETKAAILDVLKILGQAALPIILAAL